MQASSGIQFLIWLAIMAVGGLIGLAAMPLNGVLGGAILAGSFIAASLASSAVRVTTEWQRAVVLRLGKFSNQRGPGLLFVTPVLDSVPYVIDLRTATTIFRAEQTMTPDTVN